MARLDDPETKAAYERYRSGKASRDDVFALAIAELDDCIHSLPPHADQPNGMHASACAERARAFLYNLATSKVPAPADDGLAKVIVNGREMQITTRPLSYEDVVNLSGKTGQPTVTWRVKNATAGLSSGTMTPDGSFSIVPSDGMVFNVMHTSGA